MNTFSLEEKVNYKKFIFSIIDNKYKYLQLTREDFINIKKDIKKMKSAIKLNKSITELYINTDTQHNSTNSYYYDTFYDDYDIIPKIIVWFLGYSKTLKIISINNVNIKDTSIEQIFEVLKFNTILEKIEINCKVVFHDTRFLSYFLEHNTTLKVLSMQNVIFEDIYDLAEGLTKNKTLIYLNLSNSSIRNLRFLSTALTVNNTLTHLNLENVIIEEKTFFKSLFKTFEKNNGLIKVNLSNNRLIDLDINELSNSIPHNTTLKHLDLSDNNINNINVLLSSLQKNNTLKTINLRNNNIKIYKQYPKIKINNATVYK